MSTTRDLTCPACGKLLVLVDRSGVLVDACPGCRGIWLDRGELDKLMELESRSAEEADENFLAEIRGEREPRPESEHDRHDHDHHVRDDDGHGSGKKRRGSFLQDFLDFGG